MGKKALSSNESEINPVGQILKRIDHYSNFIGEKTVSESKHVYFSELTNE